MQKLVAHEGMRLDVYKDTLGINTIGIGRNLDGPGYHKDELDWLDYPSIEYVYSDGITEADAIFLHRMTYRLSKKNFFVRILA